MIPATPRRPALPRTLIRRLDRLAFRAHQFHRWAHHPLCHEYEREVFRFGRKTRLCRGCTLAAFGALAGLLAGLALPPPPELGWFLLGGGGLLASLAALERTRRSKVLSRALPASLPPFVLAMALRTGRIGVWALAALAWLAAGAVIVLYRRRGPDRTPCQTCPEATAGPVCRGYREIQARERAFRRLATRWVRQGSGTIGE